MSSRNPPYRSPVMMNNQELPQTGGRDDEALAKLPPVQPQDYLSAMFMPAEGDFTAPLPSRSPPRSPLGDSRLLSEVEARFDSKLADMDAHSIAVTRNLYAIYESELQRLRAIYRLRRQASGNIVTPFVLSPAEEEALLANLMVDPKEMEHRYRFYQHQEQQRSWHDPHQPRRTPPPPEPPKSYEIADSAPGDYGEWPQEWTSNDPPPDVETYEFMAALRRALKEIESYTKFYSLARSAVAREAAEEKAKVIAQQRAKEFAEAQARAADFAKSKLPNISKTGEAGGSDGLQDAEQTQPPNSGIKFDFSIKGLAARKLQEQKLNTTTESPSDPPQKTPTTPVDSFQARWEHLLANEQQKMQVEKNQAINNSHGEPSNEEKRKAEELKRKRNPAEEEDEEGRWRGGKKRNNNNKYEDLKAARRKEAEEEARRYKADLANTKRTSREPWKR